MQLKATVSDGTSRPVEHCQKNIKVVSQIQRNDSFKSVYFEDQRVESQVDEIKDPLELLA